MGVQLAFDSRVVGNECLQEHQTVGYEHKHPHSDFFASQEQLNSSWSNITQHQTYET